MEQIAAEYKKISVTYQEFLDKSVPRARERWVGFGVLLFLFVVRIVASQGWYIVCYSLFIYLLNQFLQFLTPKFDPSLEQEMHNEFIEEGIPEEGSEKDEEFRPFIRRLPEFKFWYNSTFAVALSIVLAFIPIVDIPVFWPILVMYFIILFSLTMKRQIQHMIKYKYLPFDFGKTKYGGRN